jgi:hypothetical protein
MNLLRRIKVWIKRNRAAPIRLPKPSLWNEDDARVWAAFLNSATGRRLANRLENQVSQQHEAACADVFHTAHSAGVAVGFRECRHWLLSLSRVTGEQVTKPSEPPTEGEPDVLEQLSP